MNILVTGAYGFIGRQVVAGLLKAGHSVVCGVRKPEPNVFAGLDTVVCDFAHDAQPEDWLHRLSDIDVVVNCAGIYARAKIRHLMRFIGLRLARCLMPVCKQM